MTERTRPCTSTASRDGETTRRGKALAAVILTLALITVVVGPAAGMEIVPLEELMPGDRCVARTVFRGMQIEEFELEILDVVPGQHPGGSLILGLASGELVERTGIMQGMSGSPVYLDGRLVGAIAMSWSFSREPIAGITPIEEMLPAFDILDGATGDAGGQGVSYAAAFDRAAGGELASTPIGRLVVLSGVTAGESAIPAQSYLADFGPVASLTPLLVGSSDGAFLAGAADLLGPLGFVPVAAWGGGGQASAVVRPDAAGASRAATGGARTSGGRSTEGSDVLEPGSSVGAQLVSGDIEMTAIGTVTHRDGDRILAFGHPLFNAGAVELPMVSARVHASMPSLAVSFKFASGAEPVGTFLQDRRRVMAGRLGEPPAMIPVTMTVSVAGAAPVRYEFDVVRSPSYAALFTGLALSDAVSEAAKVSGPATASLRVTATTADGPVTYENVFFTEGLPFRVGGEVSALVELLLLNEFRRGDLSGLTVEVSARAERRQAFIERVTAERAECAPGDTVVVHIGLRDWQGACSERTVAVVVPRSAKPGVVSLRVAGAAEYHMLEIERLGAGAYPRSYVQIVEAIADVKTEDTVVVQLLSTEPGLSHSGRELARVPGRAALVMASGAATGIVDRAEMTVLDELEFSHDRPVVGLHEIQLNIIDENAGQR